MSHSEIHDARVIQVVVTASCIGDGTDKSPKRILKEYWTLEGEKLAEYDSWLERQSNVVLAPQETPPGDWTIR